MSALREVYSVCHADSLEKEIIILHLQDVLTFIQVDSIKRIKEAPEATFVNLSYLVKRLPLVENQDQLVENIPHSQTKMIWLQNTHSLVEPW